MRILVDEVLKARLQWGVGAKMNFDVVAMQKFVCKPKEDVCLAMLAVGHQEDFYWRLKI